MYRNTYKYVNKEKKKKGRIHIYPFTMQSLYGSPTTFQTGLQNTQEFSTLTQKKKIQKEEKILRVVLFHLFLAASDYIYIYIYIQLGSNFLLMPIPCFNHPQLLSFCSFHFQSSDKTQPNSKKTQYELTSIAQINKYKATRIKKPKQNKYIKHNSN